MGVGDPSTIHVFMCITVYRIELVDRVHQIQTLAQTPPNSGFDMLLEVANLKDAYVIHTNDQHIKYTRIQSQNLQPQGSSQTWD